MVFRWNSLFIWVINFLMFDYSRSMFTAKLSSIKISSSHHPYQIPQFVMSRKAVPYWHWKCWLAVPPWAISQNKLRKCEKEKEGERFVNFDGFIAVCMLFDLHIMEILGIRLDPFILRLWAQLLRCYEKEDLSWWKVKPGETLHRFRSA